MSGSATELKAHRDVATRLLAGVSVPDTPVPGIGLGHPSTDKAISLEVHMSEEELEVLITLDDPGEDTLEEDTFHKKQRSVGSAPGIAEGVDDE
jgi:hypothetical protein